MSNAAGKTLPTDRFLFEAPQDDLSWIFELGQPGRFGNAHRYEHTRRKDAFGHISACVSDTAGRSNQGCDGYHGSLPGCWAFRSRPLSMLPWNGAALGHSAHSLGATGIIRHVRSKGDRSCSRPSMLRGASLKRCRLWWARCSVGLILNRSNLRLPKH